MPTLDQLKKTHSEFVKNVYNFCFLSNIDNLYHYTTVNALESILENGGIRISNAKFLNDSEEVKYTIRLILDIAKTLFNDNQFFNGQVNEIIEKMLTKLNNIYIFSLTTNSDSLALWSNYSHGDGYCIEFNKIELTDSIRQRSSIIGASETCKDSFGFNPSIVNIIENNVIYSEETQTDYLIEKLYMVHDYALECCIDEQYNDYLHNQFYESIATSFALSSMFFKAPLFSQEEEFRYVFNIRDDSLHKNIVRYRVASCVFIPSYAGTR